MNSFSGPIESTGGGNAILVSQNEKRPTKISDICTSRTVLEKVLGIFIIILLSIFIYMTIISVKQSQSWNSVVSPLCTTSICQAKAATIRLTMNQSVDPCQDFYQYSCGGWIERNVIPGGYTKWNILWEIEMENQKLMQNALDSPEPSFNPDSSKLKVKLFYKSCTDNLNQIEKLRGAPLQNLLKKLGDWAMPNNFSGDSFNLQKLIQKIHNNYGLEILFTSQMEPDLKNTPNYVINITPLETANIVLKEDYILYMVKTGLLLGHTDLNATTKMMTDVYNFNQKINDFYVTFYDRGTEEDKYRASNLTQLQLLCLTINWKNYLNDALTQASQIAEIRDDDKITISDPKYLQNLCKLLDTMLETREDQIILNNFIMWKITSKMAPYLSSYFRNVRQEYLEKYYGVHYGESSRLQTCIDSTSENMGVGFDAIFIQTILNDNLVKTVNLTMKMTKRLQKSLIKNLETDNWMDESTQKYAVKKANETTMVIGWPSYLEKDSSKVIDEYYANLVVNQNDYFGNILRILQFKRWSSWAVFRQQRENSRDTWEGSSSDINAFYQRIDNKIIIPAGILNFKTIHPDFPSSVNFGGMGSILGHELNHGFDSSGRQFDLNGNLWNWWGTETVKRFEERTKCLENQYGNKLSLKEDTADNGGIRTAIHAYKKYLQTNQDSSLPGLNLSNEQLFFVSYAQLWCTIGYKKALDKDKETNDHSVGGSRVIFPLANLKEFSEAFQCPLDSPMHPAKTCVVI